MIDRESAGSKRHSPKAVGSKDSHEAPIGISKKTIVSGVILVLIVVLCAVYVMQIKKGRSAGPVPDEAVNVSATSGTAEAAGEEAAAQESTAQEAEAKEAEAKEAEAKEEAGKGSEEGSEKKADDKPEQEEKDQAE